MVNITETVNDSRKNMIYIIKGSIIAFFITAILILIFSIILTYTKISETTIPVGTMIVSGCSILVGAMLSTKKIKKNGIINGAIVGLIYISMIYCISSIFGTGFHFHLQSIIMIVVSISMGATGGILGVNFRK